ncbi:unnamed protein product, partial [Heterotrigona itama]
TRTGPSNIGNVISQIVLCKQITPDFYQEELCSIQKDSEEIRGLMNELQEFMPQSGGDIEKYSALQSAGSRGNRTNGRRIHRWNQSTDRPSRPTRQSSYFRGALNLFCCAARANYFTLYNGGSVEPYLFLDLDTCYLKYMTMSFSRLIPPIQIYGIEGRYANALYSAASKQKTLNNVEKDLLKLQDLLKKDKQLGEFVLNPSIKRRDKVEGLKAIGKKVNLSSETINVLSLLAENGRLSLINNVINTFKLFMAANRGEVPCEVITAKPLDNEITSKLQAVLKGFLNKGESILLTSKIDPSIIGGMIISIGDKYIDMSVSSKVKKYSDIIAD